jgi:hypothetical protein
MNRFLRRLRGIIGTGLTWAVGFAGVQVVLNLLLGAPVGYIPSLALNGAVGGFLAGGVFAVILSIAERRRALEDLSLRRVALWGGIGAGLLLLVPMPFLLSAGVPVGPVLVSLGLASLIGAGFASGSVALARREETKLIEGDSEGIDRSIPGEVEWGGDRG